MAHGRARDERKERLWRRWIDQWRASGLSVRAFCARHGLTTASFYNWRRVLERRAADQVVFAPVQVVADAVSPQASALEVVLAEGRVVRVAPGFDAATLRLLLAVLEGRPC
jgi:transposase